MVETEINQYDSALIKYLGRGEISFACNLYLAAKAKGTELNIPEVPGLLGYSVLMFDCNVNQESITEVNLPEIRLACRLIDQDNKKLYSKAARILYLRLLESNLKLYKRIEDEGYSSVFPEVEFVKLNPDDLLKESAKFAKLAVNFGGNVEVEEILGKYGFEF